MVSRRVAFVVAHPAHLLLVAGLVQHHRPDILLLTRSETVNGRGQAELIRDGLRMLDLHDRFTSLDIDEQQTYHWALQGIVEPFVHIQEQIGQWLMRTRPQIVFGDAFELTNFQHDLGRVMLDGALRAHSQHYGIVANYEFPLACRTNPEPGALRFHEFPDGTFECYHPTPDETETKKRLAFWAARCHPFIAQVVSTYSHDGVAQEVFRAVPADRDYTCPPSGLQRHYDSRGHEMVRLGVHRHPVLFADHFVPLGRGLTNSVYHQRQVKKYRFLSSPSHSSTISSATDC